jgi:hypothetical protein
MAAFAVSSLETVTVTASHGSAAAAAAYVVGRAHVCAVPAASALPFHYCPSPSLLYHWQSQGPWPNLEFYVEHWNLLALQAIGYGSASSVRHGTGQASPPAFFSIAQMSAVGLVGWVGWATAVVQKLHLPHPACLPAPSPSGTWHGM